MLRRLLYVLVLAAGLRADPIDNLIAFTRLLGYVRYFHPSDQAAAADWEKFAIEAVPVVETARTPAELAEALENRFRPVAPSVRVYRTGQRPSWAAPAPKPHVIAWRHFGVGGGEGPPSIYSSRRVSSLGTSAQGFGNVMQSIDATPLRGKRVRFRAAVRAEGQAQLWLRVDRKGRAMGFFDNMQDRPIRSAEWEEYAIEGPVAEDAESIYFGMMLIGEGKAWLDAVELSPAVVNPDFEAGLGGWLVAGDGYTAVPTRDRPRRGRQSVELRSVKPLLPDPAQPYEADLGAGVSALVPLALYSDVAPLAPSPSRPVAPSLLSRPARLAAVALAWNVFQHFYPYFDVVGTNWPSALRRALQSASTDPDELAFLATLRRLVAELQDGHGNVFHPSEPAPFVPSIVWSWIENQLVVTVGGAGLQRGDIVGQVNRRPAAAALAERELYISGATPQWKRYHAVRVLLAGPQDSELTVEVAGRGSVTLRRTVPLNEMREPRPDKVAELRPGITYVDLDRVNDQEFNAALPRLEASKGIVFDLRGYPRVTPATIAHLLDQAVTCAQWHIPVVLYPDRRNMTFNFSNWPVQPKAPRLRGKVAFLTDGRAISYAETYLGIIEHYKLAAIVGEPTAGTNGNVNPFTLPGGYRVSWTGMKVLKHDGSAHHGVGIQPTVRVSRTVRGVREGRDEVLEAAIKLVE